MSGQIYVSPEQLMHDRAEFARKGITRGKSVIVATYSDGILLIAQNVSPSLHKLGEIYDRIAFAAVGKYNEFESLRQAGVRYADLRGYSYSRSDVTARGLASVYAQSLGDGFTTEQKPFEVELAVVEVGAKQASDKIFRLTFDGSIADVSGFMAMGGQASTVQTALGELWQEGASLHEVLAWSISALTQPGPEVSEASIAKSSAGELPLENLEVAVLDRDVELKRGSVRAFRRLDAKALAALVQASNPSI